MEPLVAEIERRFAELEQQLGDPTLIADQRRYAEVAREHKQLTAARDLARRWRELTAQQLEAEELLGDGDEEIRQMAQDQLAEAREQLPELEEQLRTEMLERDPADEKDVIVEVRAGTGGDEAALFAGDLYNMYTHYARDHGWTVEDISFNPGEHGGYKEVVFSVRGDEAYQHLRYESGGHRVQRVPKTETQGRIHTSAATVAVMPEPDEVMVDVKDSEIEWERMRAGGAGGQHVNKTESAVRIWYKRGTPEEMEVKCQDERSQHKNYDRAMRVLRTRLYERQRHKLHQARADHPHVELRSTEPLRCRPHPARLTHIVAVSRSATARWCPHPHTGGGPGRPPGCPLHHRGQDPPSSSGLDSGALRAGQLLGDALQLAPVLARRLDALRVEHRLVEERREQRQRNGNARNDRRPYRPQKDEDDENHELFDEAKRVAERARERLQERKRVYAEFGGGKDAMESPLLKSLRGELETFRMNNGREPSDSTPAIFVTQDAVWRKEDLVAVFRTFWRSQFVRQMLRENVIRT